MSYNQLKQHIKNNDNFENFVGELNNYFNSHPDETIKRFITEDDIQREMIEFTDIAGYYLANAKKNNNGWRPSELSTGQIRNFFGEIKNIQSKFDKNKVMLLNPKLEYVAAKQKSEGMKKFKEIIKPCLELISTSDDNLVKDKYFPRFVEYFESILAYHKAYGGK